MLGNGDIWQAADALRMIRHTGCAGVVIGRGCLGRPWLFRDLADAFDARPTTTDPTLGEVAAIMRRHAAMLADWMGEPRGIRDFRKHTAWYTKGYVTGSHLRRRLGQVSTLDELDDLLGEFDPHQPFPPDAGAAPRGRTSAGPRRVALPDGWLDDRDEFTALTGAELAISGG